MLAHFNYKSLLFTMVVASTFVACVPAKKFQELQAAQRSCEEEKERLKTEYRSLNEQFNELQVKSDDLEEQIASCKTQLEQTKKERAQLEESHEQLKESYDLLVENKKDLLGKSAAENKKLIEELNTAQLELQSKEDALRTLDRDLSKKSQRLDQLTSELAIREARVAELEAVLARKDSAVSALKRKVQDALLGFENNGLTIEQKNGKVYVSLDESLLFESGSAVVDVKGQEVLKKLAKVLEQNTDINIVVEGHTDNVPYNGKGEIKDNWDLSVKRATSVVKIIVNNSKVDAKRLTAAGRSEYLPIDAANTKEARQKNRRTEIILTPKLDELFKLLESN
jgi:chemotaxis protein MotB